MLDAEECAAQIDGLGCVKAGCIHVAYVAQGTCGGSQHRDAHALCVNFLTLHNVRDLHAQHAPCTPAQLT